ncbi:putative sugar epimerase YhfK [Gammaproteobacteria bacterium]|nr:putative sugar epimerase YhfK [Gammaproteobacteria bacterium]
MHIVKRLLKIIGGLVLLLVLAVGGLALTVRARQPATVLDLAPAAAQARDPRPVLVFGASGGLGVELAKALRARGQPVTAAVRASSDRSALVPLGVSFVVADALDASSVAAALRSADYQAVISTIGCLRCEPSPDFLGNRNIIDATRAAGVRRMILVTTIGAGDSYPAVNLITRFVLRRSLPLRTQAEDHLRASGLDYTIIRPGGLRGPGKAPTGQGLLSEDRNAFGFIHRADLARLILATLDDPRTIGLTLAAMDPGIRTPWQ